MGLQAIDNDRAEHLSSPTEAIEALRAILGDRLATGRGLREQYGQAEGGFVRSLPDAVGFARTTQEVSRILAVCHAYRLPVVPLGAGSSLEGQVVPTRGGLCLSLAEMNEIEEIGDADMDCLVQPGVTREQLNVRLRDRGLFFPIDPGAECTIGGMCSTRASGTNAVRYGTIRENVLGLEAVMADGRVIRTGGRARKAANGLDLTHLMVGSEGTLGVITKIRLRLHPIPESFRAAVCQFPDLKSAVDTVVAVLQSGVQMARIELMDEVQVGAAIRYSRLEGLSELPTLFLEFSGSPQVVAEQVALVEEIAVDGGGLGFAWAEDADARGRLWRARHESYHAAMSLRPGARTIVTDVCVPISRLAEAILGAKRDIVASGFVAPIVGHVGDGNFHCCILVDPDSPDEGERALELDRRIVRRGLSLGGTCSGEHGIGLGKREFLVEEHGAEALAVMAAIKKALDPTEILNPGKLYPETPGPDATATSPVRP